MHSDARESDPIDVGLLSPVTAGHDMVVSDAAVLHALVAVEVALARAGVRAGFVPDAAAAAIADAAAAHGIHPGELALAAVAGGNPVIPLVKLLKERVPGDARSWVHRGATSQDILDTALMLIARRAAVGVLASLAAVEVALAEFAAAHRDEVAAARTLTQHAVPTTIGLRASTWLRGVRRAIARLADARDELPVQLGGAAGTLASFAELAGMDAAAALPAALADELGLAVPDAPWHTTRWPVTELGDALVQAIDAVGVIAADVASASRTEIGELAEGIGGGSSAMPQKQNPAESVLIRSAALRAPQLGATLHLASAFAVDERPDGAWHAEWPTLRDLLRLALGATAHAASLVTGLRVNVDAVARTLGTTGGLIVAERLSIVLAPVIGADRVSALVAAAARGAGLATTLTDDADVADFARQRGLDPEAFVADLLDPARYTGLAGRFVDQAVGADPKETA
ncbi:lyase family protein [Microbacterium invictum]|uniref:3-carboxy-cis,cis-muconate cycloisomerase n=1 Tax=Microbacterium invictum TaxID=515415 RepID=A0AA40VNK8_9MICO|nr:MULTISPECIES: lyase family protein [Microbacterium]MBB4140987.1 3-carboxy-cis,cis-muconate cycloisomerase [Microbacterium invictum]